MGVWCRQTVDGLPGDAVQIEPHRPDQSDAELLEAKRKGARDKGWTVKRNGPRAFTATKIRWATESVCVRDFWAD